MRKFRHRTNKPADQRPATESRPKHVLSQAVLQQINEITDFLYGGKRFNWRSSSLQLVPLSVTAISIDGKRELFMRKPLCVGETLINA